MTVGSSTVLQYKDIMKILVYGTLRKNCGNDRLLLGSEFIGTVSVKGYYMFSNLAFPYAIPSSWVRTREPISDVIVGEIYDINDETLAALDKLEGVAYGHYTREAVIGMPDTQMYIPTNVRDVVTNSYLVPSGDWHDGAAEAERMMEEYFAKYPDKRKQYEDEQAAAGL